MSCFFGPEKSRFKIVLLNNELTKDDPGLIPVFVPTI